MKAEIRQFPQPAWMHDITTDRVAVIGAGAWGTALGSAFQRGGYNVMLWARKEKVAQAISDERANPTYLPDIRLPEGISATTDMGDAVADATAIILAVPTQALRTAAMRLNGMLPPTAPILLACKGLEKGTGALATEIAEVAFGKRLIGVLTGPGFAAAVTRGEPTMLTLAMNALASDAPLHRAAVVFADDVTTHLAGSRITVTQTDDVMGAQVGGALKNVVAIACGMATTMGYGENAVAALVTAGLEDMRRLTAALGGRAETLLQSCGVGDLFLTCSSAQSRNYRLGAALARGTTPAPDVIEGIGTADAVRVIEKTHSVSLRLPPLIRALWAHQISPRQALDRMLCGA
ncbi:MAG TPA: NAD(P)H-dependent glycerol-3-phosphate dehydrogenase [Acidiferrobacter sp.]|nr:NAD(P)H-dependent glycerol-3-phosphate dehydrogenase [Acidiferrobacter sp.]